MNKAKIYTTAAAALVVALAVSGATGGDALAGDLPAAQPEQRHACIAGYTEGEGFVTAVFHAYSCHADPDEGAVADEPTGDPCAGRYQWVWGEGEVYLCGRDL